DWYVAGINAEEAPLTAEIQLPGYVAGKSVEMYADSSDLTGSVKTVKADKKGKIKVTIPQNGGSLLRY
ncbi:MAG: glycoside hydrolase family 97 C-terminal domain-containing protein, partial [Muribaculaceae bacterium]|nr:glycoside hydrolase family 97 C-terminal domain-containing protein [Muribaculaceae bacterium]